MWRAEAVRAYVYRTWLMNASRKSRARDAEKRRRTHRRLGRLQPQKTHTQQRIGTMSPTQRYVKKQAKARQRGHRTAHERLEREPSARITTTPSCDTYWGASRREDENRLIAATVGSASQRWRRGEHLGKTGKRPRACATMRPGRVITREGTLCQIALPGQLFLSDRTYRPPAGPLSHYQAGDPVWLTGRGARHPCKRPGCWRGGDGSSAYSPENYPH